MNWTQIQKDNPFAWEKLVGWHETELNYREIDHPDVWATASPPTHNELRHLYDFFDEQGVYVTINTTLMPLTTDSTRFFEWYVETVHSGSTNAEIYNTRQEAEQEAFLKAFQILETKLT